MNKFIIVLLLAATIFPVHSLTDDQNAAQESFDDGFELGQLYVAGQFSEDDASQYNRIAQERNDLLNQTYGDEAEKYLLPILSMHKPDPVKGELSHSSEDVETSESESPALE